jgi:Type III flagellar switch regulator (C-ring) FliN C-term
MECVGVCIQSGRPIGQSANGMSHGNEYPGPDNLDIDLSAYWPAVPRLPVKIRVEIPIKNFRINNLLGLRNGDVIETRLLATEDIPVMAGKVHLAWSEFELSGHQLISRLTRLT